MSLIGLHDYTGALCNSTCGFGQITFINIDLSLLGVLVITSLISMSLPYLCTVLMILKDETDEQLYNHALKF